MPQSQQRSAGGVAFTLTRRRVKNLNLRVRPDGSVAVSAPMRTPLREVDAFVAAHAGWVADAQRRMAARRAAEAGLPVPDRAEALAGMQALVARLCAPLRRSHAQSPGAGHAHPLGQLQPAHPHAVLCAAAVGHARTGAGICGGP